MKLILLLCTAFSFMLYIMGIDSLSLLAVVIWGLINIILCFLCYTFLTKKELTKYSGDDFVNDILDMKEENYG